MPSRSSPIARLLVFGSALCVSACARQLPAPDLVSALPPVQRQAIRLTPPKPRVKKHDATDCKVAKVDLPSDRKEALFRQFALEQGDSADNVALAQATHSSPADCRQVAR